MLPSQAAKWKWGSAVGVGREGRVREKGEGQERNNRKGRKIGELLSGLLPPTYKVYSFLKCSTIY